MDSLKSKFPDLSFEKLSEPDPQEFNPHSVTFPAGFTGSPGHRAFRIDTIFEKDIEITLRDGTNIYTDVFRPVSGKVPAIIAWSPYGKKASGQVYDVMGPYRCGVALERTSGYEKFEGPDPAEWVERGYAIINPDARGAGFSEGDIALWGEQEALDVYDTVEWASKQPWCTGSVAMAGNSWLAVSQVNAAARCPHPALKAIAPWEAGSDAYNDLLARGGIPRGEFMRYLVRTMKGKNSIEDGCGMIERRPLFDEYWATKVAPIENIDIPMYITASFTTSFHSKRSFDTFKYAKSKDKWLRVHPYQEWYDLYRPEMNDELQGFFDKYCKGLENDWDKKPRFRLSLIGFNESQTPTILEREESEWPIARTEYRKYFLDTQSNILTSTPVSIECQTSHEGKHLTDSSDFYVRFDKYTELAGYPTAKLYMSCDQHDDMDVYVQVRKTDAKGRLLISSNYPCPVPELEVPSTNVAKFLGCDGMLRASHAVSKKVEDGGFTQYKHDKQQKIEKGAIVELDIPLWPIGMAFEAGEGIVLRVAGHDLRLPEFEHLAPTEATGPNVGRHKILSGREHQSHLIVPVIADGKP